MATQKKMREHSSNVILYRGARYVLVGDYGEKPMSDEQPRSSEEKKKINQAIKDSRDYYTEFKGKHPSLKETGVNPAAGGALGNGDGGGGGNGGGNGG